MIELLANLSIIILGLFILFKSADYMIDAISRYAKTLGLSNYIIGLVIVSMAASMPEIIASLIGALTNDPGIFFGSIIGSNMTHAALLIGIFSIIGKKINLDIKIIDKSKFFIWLILLLPFLLLIDGELNRVDGVLLITTFLVYLVILWKNEGTFGKLKQSIRIENIYKDALIFILSLIALILAGRYLVLGASNIAGYFKLPSFFVAIIVVGIGGALPDLAVGLKSILKKKQEIGIGEIIGSIIIEIILFFGIIAIIKPIKLELSGLINSMIFLIICITLLFYFISRKTINWKEGYILVILYLLFIITEILLI